MRIGTRKTTGKILASVVLVGAAASVAGLGTYGSFTSSTTASEDVSSGKVVLSAAEGSHGLSIDATNLVPGDTVQRSIVLTRSGDSERFGSVTLTTTGSAANLLTSDVANGLQLKLDQCSVPWTQGATAHDLKCTGTTATVLAQRAVIGADLDLPVATTALNSDAATSNLRATVTLPTSADNDFQGLSNTVSFAFLATQRAAESR
ncbi:TasA family protein [Nocardioides sp. T2.26MG-1]|uniref:TasA family protein n=1 Tax=Nocardioides sp. T2.26MG-1 TaxID=3041166 RepID=UPI0024775F5D|nr:TasA family protein [Nocardioides sp. T2.26MG-1]CAI9404219.1 hypothetical protein HIDPHFAB_04135 [Nocardioides sp. T2.26MG-1]